MLSAMDCFISAIKSTSTVGPVAGLGVVDVLRGLLTGGQLRAQDLDGFRTRKSEFDLAKCDTEDCDF